MRVLRAGCQAGQLRAGARLEPPLQVRGPRSSSPHVDGPLETAPGPAPGSRKMFGSCESPSSGVRGSESGCCALPITGFISQRTLKSACFPTRGRNDAGRIQGNSKPLRRWECSRAHGLASSTFSGKVTGIHWDSRPDVVSIRLRKKISLGPVASGAKEPVAVPARYVRVSGGKRPRTPNAGGETNGSVG